MRIMTMLPLEDLRGPLLAKHGLLPLKSFLNAKRTLFSDQEDGRICKGCSELNICEQFAAHPESENFKLDVEGHPAFRSIGAWKQLAESCARCDFLWLQAEKRIRMHLDIWNTPLDLSSWDTGLEIRGFGLRDIEHNVISISLAIHKADDSNIGQFPGHRLALGNFMIELFEGQLPFSILHGTGLAC